MNGPFRVAVLASGRGTNLQALIDRFHSAPDSPVRISLVVGSRPGIGALDRAERVGIPVATLSPRICGADRFPELLVGALREAEADLVLLAGYLQLIPTAVLERYPGRVVNIHPALLPAFGGAGMYGARVHAAVLESGARVSGVTVHLVTERYDEGRILAQWPVPVLPGDTPETLAARVLLVEHELLPAVVLRFAGGDAIPARAGGGAGHFALRRGEDAPAADEIADLLYFDPLGRRDRRPEP